MQPIPENKVLELWNEVLKKNPADSENLAYHMNKKEPHIVDYLFSAGENTLDDEERELLLFLGMTVWYIFQKSCTYHAQVPIDVLEINEKKIREELNGDFNNYFTLMLVQHNQKELLFEVWSAIKEEDPDDVAFSRENARLTFLVLLNVIDSLDVLYE